MNFARQTSQNTPDDIRYLCEQMLQLGVMPELEVFDLGMLNYAGYLVRKRLLRAPFYFNIILGNVASAQCELAQAGLLVREVPVQSLWAFGGIGSQQLPAAAFAIASGGGVRIGLEDNLFFNFQRRELATNMQLLERVHSLAQIFGRRVVTPPAFRERMQLRTAADGYGREPMVLPDRSEAQA